MAAERNAVLHEHHELLGAEEWVEMMEDFSMETLQNHP